MDSETTLPSSKMIASRLGSTNADPGDPNLVECVVPPPKRRGSNEKAPLLSQRRFPWSFLRTSFSSSASGSANNSDQTQDQAPSSRTLNTFAGVFSPVTLSMFSALLFLRVGYIVGNAGLLETLLQLFIAYVILVFTVTSICAISTNGAVEGGGAYFMISRTLGPELGGAIGVLFFFANVVSSALYIAGCTEGLIQNFGPSGYLLHEGDTVLPDGRMWRFLYCSCVNTLGLFVCLIGAAMFAKTSVIILAVVCVCLMSVVISFFVEQAQTVRLPLSNTLVQNSSYLVNGTYTGLSSKTLRENLFCEYGRDYTMEGEMVNFATVFGVLFSGLTGIMAGANMSGELRNPSRSIPRGTLSAVAFTCFVYVTLALLTAATCSRFLLQNNYIYMLGVNLWSPFVTIGIITATFSASLSNLIGSSRVLEAVAKDEIFGCALNFIIRGTTSSGNPIAAVAVAWFLVELFLLIGSLNLIAQLNSVLFLLAYLAMNMACLGLELASAPNFRPTFKYFTWHTALVGLLGTIIMMFVINAVYASLSMVVCLLLVIALYIFSPTRSNNWGSISQALIFHQVRKYLLMLDSRKDHVKFWRPQILLLVSNPRSACPLIDFVNDLKKGGLYVLGHVKVGNFEAMETDPTPDEYAHWLSLVDHLKVKAFVELTMSRSVREGVQHMMRISGLGAMKPNTVILGFYDEATPTDFFETEDSHFRTERFRSCMVQGEPVYTLRSPEEKWVDLNEYMAIICDILKMNKNVCLCRNFAHLNKPMIGRGKKLTTIDVWPVNFFNPNDSTSLFDTTSLFMLQLACILNMVSSWKTLKIRVFLCATQLDSETRVRQEHLSTLLSSLRIHASIHVLRWDEVLASQQVDLAEEDSNLPWTLESIRDQYISSANKLIKMQSAGTAVSLVYLPTPPREPDLWQTYFRLLTSLTEGTPPTVLVSGVSAVVTTTL